jgi:hypothetical protein
MRTAMVVGGTAAVAHHAGTKSAQANAQEQAQNQQIADLQQQQAPAPAAAAPAAPAAMSDAKFQELNQLKQLLDSGVLSQAEFDAQKQKILSS